MRFPSHAPLAMRFCQAAVESTAAPVAHRVHRPAVWALDQDARRSPKVIKAHSRRAMCITRSDEKVPMVGSVNESKPPAKATPLNADAAQRAAGRLVAAAGAELESSEVLALPRSDAPPLAIGDRHLSKLRSTISSRETLVENARPRSHVVGRSASLATNMGSAKPCATASLSLIHI